MNLTEKRASIVKNLIFPRFFQCGGRFFSMSSEKCANWQSYSGDQAEFVETSRERKRQELNRELLPVPPVAEASGLPKHGFQDFAKKFTNNIDVGPPAFKIAP
jgi:hypothetical protein